MYDVIFTDSHHLIIWVIIVGIVGNTDGKHVYHICDAKNINEAHPILKTKRGNKNISRNIL